MHRKDGGRMRLNPPSLMARADESRHFGHPEQLLARGLDRDVLDPVSPDQILLRALSKNACLPRWCAGTFPPSIT